MIWKSFRRSCNFVGSLIRHLTEQHVQAYRMWLIVAISSRSKLLSRTASHRVILASVQVKSIKNISNNAIYCAVLIE